MVPAAAARTEAILVVEVLALLIVGRVLGEGMQRLGQPALIGPLLAGLILGPSLFGWLGRKPTFDFSQPRNRKA